MANNKGFSVDDIIFNNKGIDTISQIANYQTFKNIIARNDKTLKQDIKNLPISPYIKGIYNQFEYDNKKRYKKDDFKPIIEYCKISKDRGRYQVIFNGIFIV